MMKRLLVLSLLCALTGCFGSPPTQFYTLNPVPPQQPFGHPTKFHVDVGRVVLPASLDRNSIVLRSGANRLEVSDRARWGSAPSDMIRRVLARDLAQRLGNENVLMPGDPVPSGPVRTVRLNLQEFSGGSDGSVLMDGDWSLQDSDSKVLLSRHVHLTRQVAAGDIGAIAGAQSEMLAALSDEIARALLAR